MLFTLFAKTVTILLTGTVIQVNADLQLQKNLTAKMSSVFYGNDNPILGNDGNTNGAYNPGVSCVHSSASDRQPWWMVDMLPGRSIVGVALWNRNSEFNRNTNLTIGVSSNDTVWTTFNIKEFKVCYKFTGVITTSVQNPLYLACYQPVSGRYLTVYKNGTDASGSDFQYALCEIDIFILKPKSQKFVNIARFSNPTATPVFGDGSQTSISSSSITECIVMCSLQPACFYAVYNNGQCSQFLSLVIPYALSSAISAGAAAYAVTLD